MRISRMVDEMPPSGIRRFFDIVSQMHDVISLGVGEPDFPTPWRICEAAIEGLERGRTSYTSNYGLLELREAISQHLAARIGVTYSPTEQLLITAGVSEGMDIAMRALLNPDDEVIVPQPCYVSYTPCVTFAGGMPVVLPTRAEDDFVPQAADVERLVTPRTRALLLNYPNNPTGASIPRAELERLAELALRHDLVVISDEIYDRLSYDQEHVPFPSLPGMAERTLYLNGFSKAYAMTGWRVGYAAGPEPLVAAMNKIHQYTALCSSRMAQEAALEALRSAEPDVQAMVEEYDRRRHVIVSGLNRIGLPCHLPKGAFYAFPSIEPTGLPAEEFAERLLFEGKVAVVPGEAFGAGGEGHVRCSYAYAISAIEEALDRIDRFVSRLPGFHRGARSQAAREAARV